MKNGFSKVIKKCNSYAKLIEEHKIVWTIKFVRNFIKYLFDGCECSANAICLKQLRTMPAGILMWRIGGIRDIECATVFID